eukprot:c48605_g1_i1 orf=432-629(+)
MGPTLSPPQKKKVGRPIGSTSKRGKKVEQTKDEQPKKQGREEVPAFNNMLEFPLLPMVHLLDDPI